MHGFDLDSITADAPRCGGNNSL